MRLASALLLLTFAGTSTFSAVSLEAAQTETPRKLQPIQLSSKISGPFDHLAVDLKNNRLFATSENYHAVLVMDLDIGKVIHELSAVKPMRFSIAMIWTGSM